MNHKLRNVLIVLFVIFIISKANSITSLVFGLIHGLLVLCFLGLVGFLLAKWGKSKKNEDSNI